MREHAITLVFDRTRERIDAIPAGLPDDDDRAADPGRAPAARRRTHRRARRLPLALGNAALTDDALRPALDRVVAEMRAWCDRIVALVGVPEDDRVDEACRLHALVDGLAVHVTRLAPGSPASGRWRCSTGT